MNERIREGVHLEMHLEAYAAQRNALGCLDSSSITCVTFLRYNYRKSVFTDCL